METIDRIRAKITELEAKLADLRIVERELLALGEAPAKTVQPTPPAKIPRGPKTKPKRIAKVSVAKVSVAKESSAPRQTIGTAIAEALDDQGALSVAEIAERIEKTGRAIDKRSVSYSLQAMKKQGRVKADDGKWMILKARAKPARS